MTDIPAPKYASLWCDFCGNLKLKFRKSQRRGMPAVICDDCIIDLAADVIKEAEEHQSTSLAGD